MELLNEKDFMQIFSMSHMHLKEALETAKLDRLDNFLKENPEIDKTMKTPAKELMNTQFKYLITSLSPEEENKSLYDLMKVSIEGYGKFIKSYFSVDTDTKNLKGFVALIISANEVSGIKMFSFDEKKSNITLARDLVNLISTLKEKYSVIRWDALEENPINKSYKKIVEKNNGKYTPYIDPESKQKCIRYEVPGNV